ncbi:MAG: hypothetical protein WC600_07920 [Desulfobaccales bacterium]
MIWTLLSFGIILILIAGMMVAAKLADKSSGQSREALGNCRRGAIRLAGNMHPVAGAILVPKGPR